MKRIFFVLLTLCIAQVGMSQESQLKLPDDPVLAEEAKRRFALSVDAMSIDRYRQAANSLSWLMKNAPDLYDGLYINAYKDYEECRKCTGWCEKVHVLNRLVHAICPTIKSITLVLSIHS